MRNRIFSGLIIGAALGAVLSSAGALWANGSATLTGRVAAVDVSVVFSEYQRQKDLSEEFKNKKDALDRENQSRRNAIETSQAQVDRMDPNRDPLYPAKVRELLQMQIEYKNWFDLNEADLAREVGVWTAKIYNEIVAAAGELAQKDGIDLVVYKDDFRPTNYNVDQIRQQIAGRKILFASNAADISSPLLEKLNAQYRTQPRSNMLQVPGAAAAPAPAATTPPAAANTNQPAKKKP